MVIHLIFLLTNWFGGGSPIPLDTLSPKADNVVPLNPKVRYVIAAWLCTSLLYHGHVGSLLSRAAVIGNTCHRFCGGMYSESWAQDLTNSVFAERTRPGRWRCSLALHLYSAGLHGVLMADSLPFRAKLLRCLGASSVRFAVPIAIQPSDIGPTVSKDVVPHQSNPSVCYSFRTHCSHLYSFNPLDMQPFASIAKVFSLFAFRQFCVACAVF